MTTRPDDEYPMTWRDFIPRWLTREWYAYILAMPGRHDEPLGWAYNNRFVDYANRVWCRLRGHPSGTIFYNAGGLEPNNHCKNCGDEIA